MFMGDGAHFHLNGIVNQESCPYWASKNPKLMHQRPLHSSKVGTCLVYTGGTYDIDPYFFPISMLTEFFYLLLLN